MGRVSTYAAIGLLGLTFGCGGDGTDVADFNGYGDGHPGATLKEGGEIRLDRVHTIDGEIVIAQVMAWDEPGETAILAPDGECILTRNRDVWPYGIYENATYADLGTEVVLSDDGGDTVTLARDADVTDFLGRPHKIMYGGAHQTVGVVDPGLFETGEVWTASFDGDDEVNPGTSVVFPEFPAFTSPTELAGSGNPSLVHIPAGQDYTVEWEVAASNTEPEHTADRRFDFALFNATIEPGPQWLCALPAGGQSGEFTIPQEVIDDLDPEGQTVMGRFTHTLGEFRGNRLDLISIQCAAVPYVIDP